MFQNPLDKLNTRTGNILEQPEIGAGWCTVGAQISGFVTLLVNGPKPTVGDILDILLGLEVDLQTVAVRT